MACLEREEREEGERTQYAREDGSKVVLGGGCKEGVWGVDWDILEDEMYCAIEY